MAAIGRFTHGLHQSAIFLGASWAISMRARAIFNH
jgi:hypothetical protein